MSCSLKCKSLINVNWRDYFPCILTINLVSSLYFPCILAIRSLQFLMMKFLYKNLYTYSVLINWHSIAYQFPSKKKYVKEFSCRNISDLRRNSVSQKSICKPFHLLMYTCPYNLLGSVICSYKLWCNQSCVFAYMNVCVLIHYLICENVNIFIWL